MNDPHDNAQTDREALERYRETLTHAVTVPQPLAWACAAGHCPVIMSDARPGMEHAGKLIGIHAGGWRPHPALVSVRRTREALPPGGTLPDLASLTLGALIGVARLVGVVRTRRWVPPGRMHELQFDLMRGRCATEPIDNETCARIRPWWRSGSKWGLLLSEAVLLPEPIPMRGAGGVWRIPECKRWVGGLCVDDLPHHCVPAKRALEQWRKARAT
jgi:hypothetical protein